MTDHEAHGEDRVTSLRPADETGKYPPLDPATRERLAVLLNEMSDMNVALLRLLRCGDLHDCEEALKELARAADSRLASAIGILCMGKEEAEL